MSRFGQGFGNRPYDRQGVRYSNHTPVRPVVRPNGTDYNYERPRRMIAAVKEGLTHPKPPTYRRMDMDSFLRKLPIEHCRNSTSRTAGDFKSATITLFKLPETPLSGARITETGRELQSRGYKPLESGGMGELLRKSQPDEDDYRATTGHPSARYEPREPYSFMPEPYINYSADQLKFNGYATRYLSPRITGGWRYSLRQEPFVDLRGQRPIPANIYSRYRNAHARDCTAASPWK